MTSLGRAYVATGTLLVFLLVWATIAASPWATGTDPRLAALARREALVRREAAVAQQAYASRWAHYRAALAERQALQATVRASVAPTPQVRIVQLPPVATTRSS